MNVAKRQEIEKEIVKKAIEDLLAAGYELGVNDGEETTLEHSADPVAITAAMFTTDEDYLLVYVKGVAEAGGWVHLIYGNCGWDVISDYTVNLETVLKGASQRADKLEAINYNS